MTTNALSPAFAEIRRLRTTGNHPAAFALIQSQAPASDADALEAVVSLYCAGHHDSALGGVRAWPWQLDWTRRTTTALAGLIGGGAPDAALAEARAAAHDPQAGPQAAAVYLLLLQAADRLPDAAAFLRTRLQNPPEDEPWLLTVLAEIALATGDLEQAYRRATAVLAANPCDVRALLAAGAAHFEADNPHEALGNALRAQRADPASAAAALLIMRCHNQLGDPYAALAAFAALPGPLTAALHTERGLAYEALNDWPRAIAAHEAALAAAPPALESLRALLKQRATDAAPEAAAALAALIARHGAAIEADTECGYALALGRLHVRDLDGARDQFERGFALVRDHGVLFDLLPWPVPEPLLRHDLEQLELLARRGKLDAAGQQALAVLRSYGGAASNDPRQPFAPGGAAGQTLRETLATVHYRPDPPFTGPALGARDFAALEAEYFAQQPAMVVIDDFLAPEALAALREYCEEATVWKAYNDGGYTGAFLGQGFCPRVLLAIADALKAALPRVIGKHPLMQAWAFKYDQRHQGIKVHADFAKVNVNFWITPQAACADPATGGLVVYDVPAPAHWTFADYNTNAAKMEAFLQQHDARARRVPYRENRCVLFDSRLFHVTDEIRFKAGYENRRVNVTLLYGSGNSSD